MTNKYKGFRGGGGGSQDSTTVSTPWAPSISYLKQGMKDATKLYAQGPAQYTPWSQVANFDPMQVQAQNGISDYINSNGTQNFMNTASGTYQDMISGRPNQVQNIADFGTNQAAGYLSNNNMYDPSQATNQMAYGNNTNPFAKNQADSALRQMSNNFSTNTLPGLRRQAVGNGTYGSTGNERAEGLAAGQLSSDMYNKSNEIHGNAYQTAQNNSLQALGMSANQQQQQAGIWNNLFNDGNSQNMQATQTGLSNYNNVLNMPVEMLNQLGKVGLQQYEQNQNQTNDATNRWNFQQNAPWDNFNKYQGLINNAAQYGGSGTSNTSNSTNPNVAGQALGAGMSALGAYYGMKGA